jgi:membrane protease YdiL (CAAX protease family)
MKIFGAAAAFSLLLIFGAIAAASIRIVQLEKGELDHEGEVHTLGDLLEKPGSTPISVRLDSVKLRAGEQAIFEICSLDHLMEGRWQDVLEFAVLYLDDPRLMFKTPLDKAHLAIVKRDDQGACLELGGGRIPVSGRYSIDAVWNDKRPSNEVMRVGLYAHVLGRTPLLVRERLTVVAIAFGAILFVFSLFLGSIARRARAIKEPLPQHVVGNGTEHMKGKRGQLILVSVALLAIAGIWVVVGWVPVFGSTMGFFKGLTLAAGEIAVAVLLARRLDPENSRLRNLALEAPLRHPALSMGSSLVSAVALVLIAKTALVFVPSTEEAPIETFVSWPSGMLSFAALGVIAPLSEEAFFRGFVYRALLNYGRVCSFAVSSLSFVGLHLQQVWGNWGGLVALLAAGIVLTALRAFSGSTLLSITSHLLYNFFLSMDSL